MIAVCRTIISYLLPAHKGKPEHADCLWIGDCSYCVCTCAGWLSAFPATSLLLSLASPNSTSTVLHIPNVQAMVAEHHLYKHCSDSPFTLPGEVRRRLLLSFGSILHKLEGGESCNAPDNDDDDSTVPSRKGGSGGTNSTEAGGRRRKSKAAKGSRRKCQTNSSADGSPIIARRRWGGATNVAVMRSHSDGSAPQIDCNARSGMPVNTAASASTRSTRMANSAAANLQEGCPINRSQSDGGDVQAYAHAHARSSCCGKTTSRTHAAHVRSGETVVSRCCSSEHGNCTKIQPASGPDSSPRTAKLEPWHRFTEEVAAADRHPGRRWTWGGRKQKRKQSERARKKAERKGAALKLGDVRSMLHEHNTPPPRRRRLPQQQKTRCDEAASG